MSRSPSRLRVDLTRHAWRLGVAATLAAVALALCGAATAAAAAGADAARGAQRARRSSSSSRSPIRSPADRPRSAAPRTATAPVTNYRVSASATALIREHRAANIRSRRVSEWPIEQLQMHCVLFRIPPGTTREAVIEKLQGRQARAHRAAAQRIRIGQPTAGALPAPARFDDPYCAAAVERAARSTSPRRTTSAAAPAFAWPSSTPASTRSHPDLAGRTLAHAQLHRQRRSRVSQRPARHAGGRAHRRRGQQRHRHRRRGAGRQAAGLQGLLAGVRRARRTLQFLHHRAGAGRCAGRARRRSST